MAKQIGTPYDDVLKAKAQKEADAIRAFWKARGFEVKATVVRNPYVFGQSHPGYTVQTDLRNGMPPGMAKPKPKRTLTVVQPEPKPKRKLTGKPRND